MKTPEKAELIRHALGSGLQGLMPGQNNQAAIQARGSNAAWHGSDGSGTVTKAGIAWWAPGRSHNTDKPDLTIPWRDVISVIERGCTGGNRERYEAAWSAWAEHSSAPLPEPWTPAYLLAERGQSRDSFFTSEGNQEHWAKTSRVGRELAASADAIVTAGCEFESELTLW